MTKIILPVYFSSILSFIKNEFVDRIQIARIKCLMSQIMIFQNQFNPPNEICDRCGRLTMFDVGKLPPVFTVEIQNIRGPSRVAGLTFSLATEREQVLNLCWL